MKVIITESQWSNIVQQGQNLLQKGKQNAMGAGAELAGKEVGIPVDNFDFGEEGQPLSDFMQKLASVKGDILKKSAENVRDKISSYWDSRKKKSDSELIPKGNVMMHPLGHKVKIDSGFGPRNIKSEPEATKYHRAIDLNAPSGSPVYAPLDGIVTRAENVPPPDGCGGHVRIKHSNKMETKYCHLKQWTVKKGDKVKKGDIIGYSGGGESDPNRGVSTGPHLHYAIVVNGTPVNPLTIQPNLA